MQKQMTYCLVILSTFFWGATFNAGKYVVQYISPLTVAALRFLIASFFVLIIVFFKQSNCIDNIKQNWKIFLVLGVIGIGCFNELFFYGLKYTTSVNGALIMASNPLVTLILAFFILKEPITLHHYLGIFCSLIGVILVITQGSLTALLHLKIAFGDLLILVANVCWALYTVLSKRFIKNSVPLITTASTMVVGALCLTPIAYVLDPPMTYPMASVIAALLFIALFGTVLAYLFWNYGITHLGPANTTVFFNLIPLFTVLISFAFGETVSPLQLVGGFIIILGVLISSKLIQLPFVPNNF